ncbi:MAG: hypothetical protein HY046_12870 [Acidobacteria bacterium]|nr:hypothetical protein [Acidobacteriota bacterium]
MIDANSLSTALAHLNAQGAVEVFEQGQFQAQLAGFQHELRVQGARVLLHLWSEDGNVVRQVVGIVEQRPGRMVLEVLRFGQKKPSRMEFLSKDSQRAHERLTREKFRARFRQFLQQHFPDEKIESLTAAPDLEHSFSGNYARGLMSRGGSQWAVLAAPPAELPATIEGALSFGLIWLDWVRQQATRRVVAGLRVFVPDDSTAGIAFRLQALCKTPAVELYGYSNTTWSLRRVSISDSGNVSTWLTPHREVQRTLDAARADVEKIIALAPDAIDSVVPPGTKEVALRFRGLEFARWKNGAIEFGLPEERKLFHPAKWESLKKLVRRLEKYRSPAAKDLTHPLFRVQAERWLETLLLADSARIDARLNPQFLYSQVPAFSSKDRGVLDLLGMTRSGRLVVIEIKASQDLHLPLQAADYWLRVRAHQLAGDFQRHGYFTGAELQAVPPLLYLVAPGFQFHPSSDAILRYLSPEIEVTRIGLNENWRRGIQVIFRM